MANDYVLLNDGTSHILLNDGTSAVLLNGTTAVTGLQISGTHAGIAIYGARAEQLIPIEFTFIIKSCLITLTGFKVCVKAVLERIIKSNIKVKGLLIAREKLSTKLKSSILLPRNRTDSRIYASILRKESIKAGLFSRTSKSKKKQLKEKLLRKLKDLMDEEDG